MSNVKSVISIADQFSGPLLRLSATALDSGSAVETLNEAVNIGKEYINDYVDELKYSSFEIQNTIERQLIPKVNDLVDTVSNAGNVVVDAFGASDIANSITEMTSLVWDGTTACSALTKAISEQGELFEELKNEVTSNTNEVILTIKDNLIPSIYEAKDSLFLLGQTTKDMFKNFNTDTVLEFSSALVQTIAVSKDVSANIASIGYTIYKTIKFIKSFQLRLIESVSIGAFNHLKDAYIKMFSSVSAAIERSIDDISMTDKLNAMYDEAGSVAKERAYSLANELGESSRMITELSARSAYEGIGTDHFERMMKLADKIGKLSPGQTTENAANTLIDNIKNGQDASSIARMMGGGQMMERQLKRAGYERALHRGDLDKALSIAEKIAEQAGLTDEKYLKATDNLSNNFRKIQNISENLKHRMSELFANTFAPSVKKVREFLESDKFKKIQNIVEYIVKKVGEFVNSTVEVMIDNIHWLGIFLGIGIATKTLFIFKLVTKIIGLSGPIRTILGFAFKMLSGILGKVVAIVAKHGALAAIKIAGPWAAIGTAIGGAVYGIYKLTDSTKSFSGWLMGIVAAGLKGAENVFTNVFTFFDRVIDYIKSLPELVSAMFDDILFDFDEFIYKLRTGEEHIKAPTIWYAQDTLGNYTDEERKEITQGSNLVYKEGKGWGWQRDNILGPSKAQAVIDRIQANQLKYIDVTTGMTEAYEKESVSIVEWLKKLFKQGEEQSEEQKKIQSDTNKIRQLNEQEEELAWLKAFSNRQIMSGYNYNTSNNRTTNIYGLSQTGSLEVYRRERSTMPLRAPN